MLSSKFFFYFFKIFIQEKLNEIYFQTILLEIISNQKFRAESRRRSDIIGELSSCTDEERRDDLEKEFRKSEKLEKEFRRKLLSLQSENLPDGEDSGP